MNCPKCGVQVPLGNAFCPACGEAIAQQAPPPQQNFQQAPPPQQNFQQAPPPPQQNFQQAPPPQQGFQQAPPPQQGFQQAPPPQQGYQQQYQQGMPKQDFSGTYNYSIPPSQGFMGAADYTASVHPQDAASNTTMGILSYLGILLLIPLCTGEHKRSPFVKFHLNQGLMLAICAVGYTILSTILTSVIRVRRELFYVVYYETPGWLYGILSLISLPLLGLLILGIVNVVNKKSVELPFIGKMRFIK